MPNVVLFCEDVAHETVLSAVLQAVARAREVPLDLQVRSATGGSGRVLRELKQFIRDLKKSRQPLPDLLVVGRDANCKGVNEREKELEPILQDYGNNSVCAIPEPHVERWLLLDPAAFKSVFGHGCDLPDNKCDKDEYKNRFQKAILDAGQTPLLGGIEHAADLIEHMDLSRVERTDQSFGRFLKEIRKNFNSWKS